MTVPKSIFGSSPKRMRPPASPLGRLRLHGLAFVGTRAERGRRERTEVALDASRIVGGPDPVTGIDSLDMLAAVGHLDPDDRTLLALRYGLGYDATELSAVTGISPAGTRQRLKRLLDRLRQELE